MEIASEYPDFHGLQSNISILFRTDLACRLSLTLDGIRLAVEFFVSNWTALKEHSPPVIVGTCLLSAGYLTHTSTKKARKVLMDVFRISLSSMKSCLYEVLKAKKIPLRYGLNDPALLLLENYERIFDNDVNNINFKNRKEKEGSMSPECDPSQYQFWRHYRDMSPPRILPKAGFSIRLCKFGNIPQKQDALRFRVW